MAPFKWKISEEEIQDYIVEMYESKGYECINFHKSGASVEGSVDILAKKNSEEIAFCVKIKPKKEDLIQMHKFSETKFKEKVYVYIRDPTRPFFDGLEESNINSFNASKLHELLIENKVMSYIKRYLFSHEFFDILISLLYDWHSVKNVKIQLVENKDLPLVWDWKDRSVNFNKITKVLYDVHQERLKNIIEDEKGLYNKELGEIIKVLDYLTPELERLKVFFTQLKHSNPGILSYLWVICRPRSNWCSLLMHLDEDKNDKEEIFFDFYRYFYKDMTDFPYTFLIDFLQGINYMAENFEDGVDWIFSDRKKK